MVLIEFIGPGCSSLGFGAMKELGPFRVNPDGKTLSRNKHAWNNVKRKLKIFLWYSLLVVWYPIRLIL